MKRTCLSIGAGLLLMGSLSVCTSPTTTVVQCRSQESSDFEACWAESDGALLRCGDACSGDWLACYLGCAPDDAICVSLCEIAGGSCEQACHGVYRQSQSLCNDAYYEGVLECEEACDGPLSGLAGAEDSVKCTTTSECQRSASDQSAYCQTSCQIEQNSCVDSYCLGHDYDATCSEPCMESGDACDEACDQNLSSGLESCSSGSQPTTEMQ